MTLNNISGRLAGNTLQTQEPGHSPLGSLDGHGVQQLAPGRPRSIGQTISRMGHALMDFGARALNALTPQGVRAESKLRMAQRDLDAQVAPLLVALSNSPGQGVDQITARKILNRLPSDNMRSISPGRADLDSPQMFGARVDVALQKMTLGQLQSLKSGLELAKSSSLREEKKLASIEKGLDHQLTQHMLREACHQMLPRLQAAIKNIENDHMNPGAVAFHYDKLMDVAAELLHAHGQTNVGSGRTLPLENALIKVTVDTLVSVGDLQMQDLVDMYTALPPWNLRDMLDARETYRVRVPLVGGALCSLPLTTIPRLERLLDQQSALRP